MTAETSTSTATTPDRTNGTPVDSRPHGGSEQAARPVTGPHWGLEPFRDALRIPPRLRLDAHPGDREVTIATWATRKRLHSQLPLTNVWAYEGHSPGPTIEVRRGQRVRINWHNGIDGTIPLVGVGVTGVGPAVPQVPGWRNADGTPRAGHAEVTEMRSLHAWNVVHLHGSLTNGWNDGWATGAIPPGSEQRTEYPNDQVATGLWYHDHAMDVTRLNVHAGLNGMYLIRDEEEAALGLPSGEHEVPLVLRDCNLDTDPATGRPNGRLLFKYALLGTPDEPVNIPFTGPFNTVNGVIWPHFCVEARWYRLRILNTANSRFYRLRFLDDADPSQSVSDAVRIIGTDGGLLPAPAGFPSDGVDLAPAERLDVLVDFGSLRGRRILLRDERAMQPDGTAGPTEAALMQFRVDRYRTNDRFCLPRTLARSYVRLEHGTTVPEDHDHRFVALVPPGTQGSGHPQIWELGELEGDDVPQEPTPGVIQVTDPATAKVRTFEVRARVFHDTTTFFQDEGRFAVWNFLHLGGPAHPMHIHMTEFQVLSRRPLAVDGFDSAQGWTTAPLTAGDPEPLDDYEVGWKDTFITPAATWLTVAGEFSGATGNFMYHCHILDHEDAGMMRPFMVRPADVGVFDQHHSHGGHGH